MADLFYFNPGCELEVAHGSASYNLQKHPRILESDLSVLPMFFSHPGDYVASCTRDVSFIDFWRDLLPCTFVDIKLKGLKSVEFDRFVPWGISPRVQSLVAHLKFSDRYMSSPSAVFTQDHRRLFSRESSVLFFHDLIERFGDSSIMPSADELPFVTGDVERVWDFFNSALSGKFHGSVFKAIYGSSGRGVRILRNNVYSDNLHNWISSMIASQGAIECEYLFDKVFDFSMHYDIVDGKAIFVGVSSFSTAETGAYQSSLAKRLMDIPGNPGISAERLSKYHVAILNDSIYTKLYNGPLGIDCMVYRGHDGSMMVNPCVEINCRHSMGRLAMELSRFVDDSRMGEYFVYQKAYPSPEFSKKAVFSNGKLVEGFLPLTPNDTQMFAAGLLVK